MGKQQRKPAHSGRISRWARTLPGPIVRSGLLLIVAILCASFVSLFAVIEHIPYSWAEFGLWAAILIVLDAWFLYTSWKYWHRLSPRLQVFIIDYAAATLWYWALGPFFQYLTMDFDGRQIAIAAFAFFWEVPFFGSISCLTGQILFNPIARYLKSGRTANPVMLLRRIENFPLAIVYRSILFTTLSYAVGAWQIRKITGLPAIEFYIDVGNGLALSLFLSLFYSLVASNYLSPIRLKAREQYHLAATRHKLFTRIFNTTVILTLASLSLLLLVYVKTFQLSIKSELTAQASTTMQTTARLAILNQSAIDPSYFRFGARGESWALNRLQTIPSGSLSGASADQVLNQQQGVIYNPAQNQQLIVFDSSGDYKMASVIYLSDYYGTISDVVRYLIIGEFFICMLSVGAMIVFLRIMSSSTSALVQSVREAEATGRYNPPSLQFGDELDDLSEAFKHFVSQTHERSLQLQQERARLKASIDSIDIGYMMTDRKGKVILSNTALHHIIDASPQASLTIEGIAEHVGHGTVFMRALHRAVSDRAQSSTFEVDSGQKYLRVFVVPVTPGQRAMGAVVLLQDITEEHNLSRSKDEFFSIASHELRTPLTSIRGNTSMMLSIYHDSIKDPEILSMLSDIHDSSTRLIAIVNDFLDVSRLEQGRMQFTPDAFSIIEAINQVVGDIRPSATDQDTTIEVSSPDASLPEAFADRARIKQVLYNIISNSLKHIKANGHVRIIISAEKKGFVTVRVTDDGEGIPLANQKLLFRKLQQAGANILTRDSSKGTGLGLYIAKLMLTQMGGGIVLERSTPGSETTFCFWITAAKTAKTNH